MEAKNRLHQSISRILTATFQGPKLEFVRKPIMKAASLAIKLVVLCSDESDSIGIDMDAVKAIEMEFERCRNFLSSIAKHYEKDVPASKIFLNSQFNPLPSHRIPNVYTFLINLSCRDLKYIHILKKLCRDPKGRQRINTLNNFGHF